MSKYRITVVIESEDDLDQYDEVYVTFQDFMDECLLDFKLKSLVVKEIE